MAGLELFTLFMQLSIVPNLPPQHKPFINMALGCKPFDLSAIESHVVQTAYTLKKTSYLPDECKRLPFKKTWLEFSRSNREAINDQGDKTAAYIIEEISPSHFSYHTIFLTADGTINGYGPHSIPDPSRDDMLESMILSAIFAVNSSHVETIGHRISPTLERKIKRSGIRWPHLSWSEIRLRPGETISIQSGAAAGGGWKMPWHEVRGHWHWYQTRHGVQRGEIDSLGHWHDKPGFWVHNWLDAYDRGDDTLGIKRTRYKMVA